MNQFNLALMSRIATQVHCIAFGRWYLERETGERHLTWRVAKVVADLCTIT